MVFFGGVGLWWGDGDWDGEGVRWDRMGWVVKNMEGMRCDANGVHRKHVPEKFSN